MSDNALRYNEGKLKWSLVHWKSLEPLVEVLTMGAKKYAPHNWKKPMNREEILESAMRHLTSMMDGEFFDKESKLPHAGHVMANMMFYIYHSCSTTEKLLSTEENKESLLSSIEELNNNDNVSTTCCGKWDEEGNCDCENPVTRVTKPKIPVFDIHELLQEISRMSQSSIHEENH